MSVSANLVMELNVECPHCEHRYDLFQSDENTEGSVYEATISDESWNIESSERIDSYFTCPECEGEIHVKGVNW